MSKNIFILSFRYNPELLWELHVTNPYLCKPIREDLVFSIILPVNQFFTILDLKIHKLNKIDLVKTTGFICQCRLLLLGWNVGFECVNFWLLPFIFLFYRNRFDIIRTCNFLFCCLLYILKDDIYIKMTWLVYQSGWIRTSADIVSSCSSGNCFKV